jgi:hypothetical protein
MEQGSPDFLTLSQIEEDFLTGRLEAIRKSIFHAGEKGRSLEGEVMSFLRTFLPTEYALSTGFVVYHSAGGIRLSPQLDIVIYDPLRTGPIARLSTCDVFPLEAVYGYVEVKASIVSTSDDARNPAGNSIEGCIAINKELRNMTERRFWIPVSGSPVEARMKSIKNFLAIRSYVFAFSAEGETAKNPPVFAQRIAKVLRRTGNPAHLHGLFVAGSAFYSTRPVDEKKAKPEDYFHINFTDNHPLAAFKWSLLRDLARFTRIPMNWAPGVDQYSTSDFAWRCCAPGPAD